MTPLKSYYDYRRGYTFKERTWYSRRHLGTDIICPKGTVLYAPFDGRAILNPFPTGGTVIDFHCTVRGRKYVMRFMHLKRTTKLGAVKEGDIIGQTGNSGTLTTGPHLHLDISKNKVNIYDINNFVDPDKFKWGGSMPTCHDKLKKCYSKRDQAWKKVKSQRAEIVKLKKQLADCKEGKSLVDKIKELINGKGE